MTVFCWKRFWLIYSKKLILHEKHLKKNQRSKSIFSSADAAVMFVLLFNGEVSEKH